MEKRFKPGSFRGKINEVMDTSRYDRFADIPFPDPDENALSFWDYAQIKEAVGTLMDSMLELGFKVRECAQYTYQTLRLSIWGDRTGKVFTENVLIATAIMLRCESSKCLIDEELKSNYRGLLERWTKSHFRGYRLSVPDEEELEKDIVKMLRFLDRCEIAPNRDMELSIHDFLENASPELWNKAIGHTNLMRDNTPPGYIEAIQNSLSEEAFLLITRFERDYYNPNRYKFFLEANGMAVTPEVQRYFDLYDGRAFIYRDASFYINRHCGMNKIKGYSTGNDVGAIVMNNYYLLILSKLTCEEEGLFIDMYGRIHEYSKGFLRLAANTFEEYLELYARKQRRSWLMINTRREIEEKYFHPDIRLLNMRKMRRGVYV